jgi:hypothetical protein
VQVTEERVQLQPLPFMLAPVSPDGSVSVSVTRLPSVDAFPLLVVVMV